MKNYTQVCLLAMLLVGGCSERKTGEAVADKSIHVKMSVDKLIHTKSVYFPHGWGAGIAKKGNYIYLTKNEGHTMVAIIDVSDENNPKVIDYLPDLNSNKHAMNPLVDDNLLVWQDQSGRWVPYDISNPAKPVKYGEKRASNVAANKMDPSLLRDRYLYYGANCTEQWFLNACIFQIYEIKAPFEPVLISSLDLMSKLSPELKGKIDSWKANSKANPTEKWWHSQWPGNTIGRNRTETTVITGNIIHLPFLLAVFGIDISDVSNPKMVYKYENGEQIRSIAVKDKILFVCSAAFDVTWTYKLATDQGVSIVDISEPENVKKIGEYRGLQYPQYGLLKDNRLYVIGAEDIPQAERSFKGVALDTPSMRMVLHVLDVTDPRSLKCIGTYQFPGRNGWYEYCCQGMIIEKNILYVGDPATGLRILDVSDPKNIKEISVVPQEGEATHIALIGNYAYVGNAWNFAYNMYAIGNIQDPEKAKLVGINTFLPGGQPGYDSRAWFASGNENTSKRYLYIPRAKKLIAVVDLLNSKTPVLDRYVSLPDNWETACVGMAGIVNYNNCVFVLGHYEKTKECGIIIFEKNTDGNDLKCIKEMIVPGILNNGHPTGAMTWCRDKDKIYIISLEKAKDNADKLADVMVTIIDIKNPAQPQIIGTHCLHKGIIKEPGRSLIYYKVICKNNYLYLLGENIDMPSIDGKSPKPLYIYDVSDPKNPFFVSDLEEKNSVYGFCDMAILGDYPALVLQDYADGISLVDVSDVKNPKVVWREPSPELKWPVRYPKCGFSAGEYRDGYLYIPRLERLDIYKIHLGDNTNENSQKERINKIINTAKGFQAKDAVQKGVVQSLLKTAVYYQGKEDLASTKDWIDELEQRMKSPASYPAPDMAAVQSKSPVIVDGKDEEWKDIPVYTFPEGKATVKLQWDDKFLYFLFDIQDKDFRPATEKEGLWLGDGVEIYLNTTMRKGPRDYGATDYQYIISANRMRIQSNNPRFAGKPKPESSQAAFERTKTGYRLEIALSHSETWIEPTGGGMRIAWMGVINDRGVGNFQAKYTGDSFSRTVGANWPQMELAPAL